MSQPTVRWVSGAGPAPRYLEVGEAGHLRRVLRDLPGLRGRVETVALALRPVRQRTSQQEVPDVVMAELVELARLLGEPVQAAFLLWTGFYKRTSLVGPVVLRGGVRFIKLSRATGDIDREAYGVERLRPHFAPDAELLTAERIEGRLAVYPMLPSRRRRASPRAVSCLALRALSRAQPVEAAQRVWVAAEVLDAVLDSDLAPDAGRALRALNRTFGPDVPTGCCTWTHGDLTTWNVVRLPGHRLVVIDCEAVGIRPLAADVVHAPLQLSGLQGRRVNLIGTAPAISQALGCDLGQAVNELTSAVLVDLGETLTTWLAHPDNRVRVGRLIAVKARAAIELSEMAA